MGVFAVAVSVNLIAQIGIHRTSDETRAHGPIANVVRAFILYSTAIILGLRPEWVFWMAVFYLGFEITLKLRPEERQV